MRRLRERGAEVRCALTASAASFVAPLALEVVSSARVWGDDYLEPRGRGVEEHIEAAGWADVVVLAPATAHLLARAAHGLADDFLTTTLLACAGPCLAAPAMHWRMWENAAVQENVRRLQLRGWRLIGPLEGALASGETGMGRMAEPEAIAAAALRLARPDGDWRGRRVVVSAGPTHEPIDPVRFLGNRSSGKMGFALAAAAAERGAEVTLVAGPVALETPPGVRRVDVETARQMRRRGARAHAPVADLVIMAAAVADFRAREQATGEAQEARRPAADSSWSRTPTSSPELGRAPEGRQAVLRRLRRRNRRPRRARPREAGRQGGRLPGRQ